MPDVLDLKKPKNHSQDEDTSSDAPEMYAPRQRRTPLSLQEPPPSKPKIDLIIGFLLLGYMVVIDLIGIALIFIAMDDFFILDILSWPVTWLYFRIKGVNGTYNNIMSAAELIPYVGVLPLKTVGVFMVLWIDRHPEGRIAKTTKKASIKNLGGGAK